MIFKWILFNNCAASSVQPNPGLEIIQSIPLVLSLHGSFRFHLEISKLIFAIMSSSSLIEDGCLFSFKQFSGADSQELLKLHLMPVNYSTTASTKSGKYPVREYIYIYICIL